ncbi:MAG: class I SAM-dependent methyltransferase [Bacteroidales bacterium]|jgi:ubiquinone/menaquinone biosynthesis C-methylase UbiE|nr:class I SAM-dependent methyltransferase [Bacteroidales bacterium]
MKRGDFTKLAKAYVNRPAYGDLIVSALLKYVEYDRKSDFKVADVGAGTGKFTKMLLEKGLKVLSVEPNDAMRSEGIKDTKEFDVKWSKGSGGKTGLEKNSVDWVTMASSFHWTNPNESLSEFHRILKPGGYFTAIWNPKNIEKSEFNLKIEKIIYEILPNIQRVSSGSRMHAKNWEDILISTKYFKDVIFMECDHEEIMSKERYLGAWNSVNDIRVQAGENNWEKIIKAIGEEIKNLEKICVPYKMRAWTAQRID